MSGGTGQPTSGLDAAGLPPGYPFRADWEITPRDVAKAMRAEVPLAQRPLLIDCRRAEEYAVARISGSVLVPLETISGQTDRIEDQAGSKERAIIVHCHHGVRSMKATMLLRQAGFTDVRSMAGGIDLWSISIDPRVSRY